MDARKNNKGSKGNKGGGRLSAYEEWQNAEWHANAWEVDSDVPVLQAKLKSGKYSVRDVFLAKALQGNERILGIFANKLLPDLVDHTTKGEKIEGQVLSVHYIPPHDPDHKADA